MMTIVNTPGKVFAGGETVDNDKLNLLGAPSSVPTGSIAAAQVVADAYFFAGATGVADAYTLTLAPVPAAYVTGMVVRFVVIAANTGATTINVNGLGAKDLQRFFSTPLKAGDLLDGDIVEAVYNGTKFLILGPGPSQAWNNYGTGGGAANAHTVTLDPVPTAYVAGMIVRFLPTNTNTLGVVTVNVNGLGAKNINKQDGALAPGDIQSAVPCEILYDGTVFQLRGRGARGTEVPATLGTAQALVVRNVTATPLSQVQATWGGLVVADTNNALAPINIGSGAVSADITVSGLNGLDTGAEAASTWYYIWVIWNPLTQTAGCLLSVSASAPTMPTGYTMRILVGAVFNLAGSNFVNFWQIGRRVFFDQQVIFTAFAATGANTYQALAGAQLTAFQGAVPPHALEVMGVIGTSTDAFCAATIAGGITTAALGAVTVCVYTVGALNSLDSFFASGGFTVPLAVAQNIIWKAQDTSAKYRLCVNGFTL